MATFRLQQPGKSFIIAPISVFTSSDILQQLASSSPTTLNPPASANLFTSLSDP